MMRATAQGTRGARCANLATRAVLTTTIGPCKPRRCRRFAAPGRTSRQLTVTAKAMVNVDFASPSLVLGAILIGCGVLLLQMRNLQTKVSRDADIVVAAMISIVGSTLIFQGWRLDPLLLLCQALTTSVAVWYGIETFRLRSKEEEMEAQGMLPPPQQGAKAGWMPPPTDMQSAAQPGLQPQQPQQGGMPDWMTAFTGAVQPQQGFMQGAPQQQQPGYPQQPQQPMQAPPGGYLPPAQDQQYPWMNGAGAMQYGMQQQGMQAPVASSSGAAPWQYGSSTGQYGAGADQQWPQQLPADGQYAAAVPSQVQYGEYMPVDGMQVAQAGGGPEDPYYVAAAGDGYGMYAPAADAYQAAQTEQYTGYRRPEESSQAAPGAYSAPQAAPAAQPVQALPRLMERRVMERIDDWE